MKRNQFVFTRSEHMTEKQKRVYDMLFAWGRSRFELLVGLIGLLFTEEEMENPETCLVKLNYMLIEQRQGRKPISPPASTIKSDSVVTLDGPEPVSNMDDSDDYLASLEQQMEAAQNQILIERTDKS